MNPVASVFLLRERPFVIGNRIRVKEVSGEVEGIGLRTIVLRDVNEERIVVSRATIFTAIVMDRAEIDFCVWHDSAEDVAVEVMQRLRLSFPQATVTAEARQ